MSKIAVIGSRGFLARRLISELRTRSQEVLEVEHLDDDASPEVQAMYYFKPDFIFHCALVGNGGYLEVLPDLRYKGASSQSLGYGSLHSI